MKYKWLFILMTGIFCSCKSVKPYERAFLSDPEMQMEANDGAQFESYVHSIREGATPAAGSKSSGGCGCN